MFLYVAGRGEVAWAATNDSVLSAGSGTNFMPSLNQSKTVTSCDHQLLTGVVHGPSSVYTSAFLTPPVNVPYAPSTAQLTGSYTADRTQMDLGCVPDHMSSAFTTSTSSHILDAVRNVDHCFGAGPVRSQNTHSRADYIGNYSPVIGETAPATCEVAGAQVVSHLPAHEWSSAAELTTSAPRSPHISSSSWHKLRPQADIECSATGSVYSMPPPLPSPFSPSRTSMQYSAVTSIGSPDASGASDVPSPLSSPYSPSVGKTFSDLPSSDVSNVPLHMQPQYLENLLQLQYLLLASNKLLAPRCPPSLGAQRFDSYIPGSASSAARPSMFDVSHLSFPAGSFHHGFTPARFPRLALRHLFGNLP